MRRFFFGSAIILVGLLFSSIAFAVDDDHWTGPYFGIGAGDASGRAKSDAVSMATDSAAFILYAGYQKQFGRFVLGGESDFLPVQGLYGKTSIGCPASVCGGLPVQENYNVKTEWAVAVRINAGYAFDRLLPYVTIGYDWGQAKVKVTVPAFGVGDSETHGQQGIVFGGGLKYAVSDHWLAGVEYIRAENHVSGISGGYAPTNLFLGVLHYRF